MYLHIGKNIVINENDIIAIFNMNYIKNTKMYKNLLEKLSEQKKIINISNGKEKTLILVDSDNCEKAYITNINSSTIGRRKL